MWQFLWEHLSENLFFKSLKLSSGFGKKCVEWCQMKVEKYIANKGWTLNTSFHFIMAIKYIWSVLPTLCMKGTTEVCYKMRYPLMLFSTLISPRKRILVPKNIFWYLYFSIFTYPWNVMKLPYFQENPNRRFTTLNTRTRGDPYPRPTQEINHLPFLESKYEDDFSRYLKLFYFNVLIK